MLSGQFGWMDHTPKTVKVTTTRAPAVLLKIVVNSNPLLETVWASVCVTTVTFLAQKINLITKLPWLPCVVVLLYFSLTLLI